MENAIDQTTPNPSRSAIPLGLPKNSGGEYKGEGSYIGREQKTITRNESNGGYRGKKTTFIM